MQRYIRTDKDIIYDTTIGFYQIKGDHIIYELENLDLGKILIVSNKIGDLLCVGDLVNMDHWLYEITINNIVQFKAESEKIKTIFKHIEDYYEPIWERD